MQVFDMSIPIHETKENLPPMVDLIEKLAEMLDQYQVKYSIVLPSAEEMEKDKNLIFRLFYSSEQSTEVALIMSLFIRFYLKGDEERVFRSIEKSYNRIFENRIPQKETIAELEKKLAAAESEKEAVIRKTVKANVYYYPATEYRGRKFKIYQEEESPYENQKPEGEIELSEGVYMGGDLYIVPMQVYKTENPALLKVVFMIAGGCNSLPYSTALETDVAKITNNNIRTGLMTLDKKLYYYYGAKNCEGTYDLTPQAWRLEGE